MTAVRTVIGMPQRWEATAGATTYTTTDLANQNSIAFGVMQAELVAASGTENITKVSYRQGVTTGTPATDSYRIGLQGVTSGGLPDGTWLNDGGGDAYVDFTPTSADDGNRVTLTLAFDYLMSRGQAIAIVCVRTAATDASNKITVSHSQGRRCNRTGLPYPGTGTVASPSRSSTGYPAFGYQSATNKYGDNNSNVYSTTTFGSTTEVGFTFTIPTTRMASCVAGGVNFNLQSPATGANTYTCTLYSNPTSGSTTIIAQANIEDTDLVGANSSADRLFEFRFADATLPTLTAGTKYAVGVSVSTASGSNMVHLVAQDAGDFSSMLDSDLGIAFCSRTLSSYPPSGDDTGNFTETTTQWPMAELLLLDVTMPAGGGGGGSGFVRPVGAGGLVG